MIGLIYLVIFLGLFGGFAVAVHNYAVRHGWVAQESSQVAPPESSIDQPIVNSPIVSPPVVSPPVVPENIGRTEVVMVSPSLWSLPVEQKTYTVKGHVTPNATQIEVQLIEHRGSFRDTKQFTIADFELGDTQWKCTVGPGNSDLQSSGLPTMHEVVVTATFADNTTKTVSRMVSHQFSE